MPNRPYDTRVNVFSTMNPDMDYSFVVSSCRAGEAQALLSEAFDKWFDDDQGLTLYETLEAAIVNAGIPFEDYLIPICVYCDSTPLYTESEILSDNLTDLLFPEVLVREWYASTIASDNIVGGDFENWLENESTADDTDGLYAYALSRGFSAERTN
ncbi:MAG: hypothetical protein IKY91_05565 [Akkermansia sp.]|nr:hypothetical protein [Akkermansia sp.]